LLEGAPPNAHRAIARAITWAGRASTARTSTARWFETALPVHANGNRPAPVDEAGSASGFVSGGPPQRPQRREADDERLEPPAAR
jgi:hypothetical protein